MIADSDEEDIGPLVPLPSVRNRSPSFATDSGAQNKEIVSDLQERETFHTLHLGSIMEEISFVYDYLSTRTTKRLQSLLTTEHRNTSGSDTLLVARMLLHIYTELRRNLRPISLLLSIDRNDCEKYMQANKHRFFMVPPSPQELLNVIPSAQERTSFTRSIPWNIIGQKEIPAEGQSSTILTSPCHQNTTKSLSAEFTDEEFARLLLLLLYEEVCKRTIERMFSELPRKLQDAGAKGPDLWNRIAERFNSSEFSLTERFEYPFENLDPSLPPLNRRSGEKLSHVMRDARSVWTSTMAKYDVSGNNGERPFKDFCHKSY
ncbi:hypothetical protein BWQ96_05933 [Gracilariopsis chorda]|uniref:Uncharacterized protein n=1 Tax=Gracilariopsis chorda TaxID=448386 RepID=A0A2V3IQD5_9FLOR|nr:hypothetical protein BWQ96_05933 [Gracilariopsis chorda]|eukprot:PXF44306.1 hypothetical protein BWQ96_05933 [Gracilariopsis chorda]